MGGRGDVVILATPVDVALSSLITHRSSPITSVCSVMSPLRAAADANGIAFVAGHPLAGSERRGLAAARGDLFEGKTWFVDRDEPLVNEIIAACGARIERVTAEEHDRAVALTSHLPQLLSTALAALAGAHEAERFAGGGLRTFLRLAESDATVWMPVLAANRANIAPYADELMRLARAILDGDAAAFARAQQFVRRLP